MPNPEWNRDHSLPNGKPDILPFYQETENDGE